MEKAVPKLAAAVENWNWENVTLGEVALVVRGALRGEISPDARLGSFIQKEILSSTSDILLGVVAETYIDQWRSGDGRTLWLANAIRSKSEKLPSRWKKLFGLLPELLNAQSPPSDLAAKMVEQQDPYTWLLKCGILSPHSGLLMASTYSSWLVKLPDVRSPTQVQQIFNWIRPNGKHHATDDMAAAAIDKVLEPWRRETPSPGFQLELLNQITGIYGDPRHDGATFWPLVTKDSRDIVKRWLAGKSMDALLEIITKATANHMWQARHHFWKSLYDRKIVTEAWIVLSPAAARIAEDMFNRTGDEIYKNIGIQVAKTRRDTCLMIMRVGNYVVVEGSHDYRAHLFRAGNPDAPDLYEAEYDAEALTFPANDPWARIHDAPGQWMRWIEERVTSA